MQTSMVFSQRTWPQVGDIDDCWVLSAIQAVNVVAPWLDLPGVTAFRAAAGDPDDGVTDNGNLGEIARGIVGVWPVFKGRLRVLEGVSWAAMAAEIGTRHRPVSVSVLSSALPPALRFGYAGPHQVTLAMDVDRRLMFANPLAAAYSRWIRISWTQVQPAILAYGRARAGRDGAWGVSLPSTADMLRLHPLFATELAAAIARR